MEQRLPKVGTDSRNEHAAITNISVRPHLRSCIIMVDKKIERIGVLTAGGDCPGLNAVIRSVSKTAIVEHGWDVIGIEDGFLGLIEGRTRPLSYDDVSGILSLGGTILGTSNKADPFAFAREQDGKLVKEDVSQRVIETCRDLGIDAIITIGGDGTQSIAGRLAERGMNIVGIPKTIDNDLAGTDVTFGFDPAVGIITEALDRIHTTAMSHHRAMVIEVMGRNAGWLALHAGIAGGGDILLLPEIPFDIEEVCRVVDHRSRRGKRFSIIVVSEGAKPAGGTQVVKRVVKDSADPIRLGGIGKVVADGIQERTGIESRVTVLGHLQRGGPPSSRDRVLGTLFGRKAVDLISQRRFGRLVADKGGEITSSPLSDTIGKQRCVPKDHYLLDVAISVGTSFGVKEI